ncbi:MAG: TRAP transporter substrate-binding protein DctP [bacterium]|nr:TRAP transporter substrate-binding protein DctP [bacterium]
MKLVFTFITLLSFQLTFAQTEIKFASVAPDGSTWMKTMRAIADEVKQKTNGKVTFKFYPGGVQGDEADMLRKIRINQLHAAGFTGNGLGEVLPEIRVMEVPYLFQNEEQVDAAANAVQSVIEKGFEEKGFIFLGWVDVGFVHFFSKERIQTINDLRNKKVWMWQGDHLAKTLFENFNITPIQLPLTDVLTALQTGMIDVVYASPYAALAMQWHTRTKYISELPVTYASGAVLISKSIFSKLTPEQQNILKEVCKTKFRELTLQTRKDNQTALETLKKAGMQISPKPNQEELKKMQEIGIKTREKLVDKLYPRDLLLKVENAVKNVKQ